MWRLLKGVGALVWVDSKELRTDANTVNDNFGGSEFSKNARSPCVRLIQKIIEADRL